jgi:kynurenine formamidase
MKNTIYLFAILLLVACQNGKKENSAIESLSDRLQHCRWVDLTYSFEESSVYWPTNIPFHHDTVSYGMTAKGYFYSSFKFSAEEHGGTHFDAPIHFCANMNTIEKVPLKQLNGPGVVVNVTDKSAKDRDYLISIEDFKDWEKKHGQIPEGSMVLIYTGYGKYYNDPEKYLGTNLKGPQAISHLHFPGLSPEAAQWLVDNRKINGVGLDTPSIDYGQSSEFMTHRILCNHSMTMYENVANLDQLPAAGSYIIALPMKIKGGSGSPLRIIAII